MTTGGIAWAVLSLVSAYLILLGLVALLRPSLAYRFLSGFAQTGWVNLSEAGVRTIVGLALVRVAEDLPAPSVWSVAGWFLVATAIWMIAFPATHRRIAARSTATIRPALPLVGVASIAIGAGLALLVIGA